MAVSTGLDVLQRDGFKALYGKRIGLLCHQASVNRELRHIIELLLPLHRAGKLEIKAVFGPQHGLWGHTQDNMIEWEGYTDRETGLKIYSLYGEIRKPRPEMLEDIDLFLIDLQDVGARYYTFTWTMALCMEACTEQGIKVMVTDRPNPITGRRVEGTVQEPGFDSFVGLYPLPQRHGMTIGEIALYLQNSYFNKLELEICRMEGWKREMQFSETGLAWTLPSPNMPLWETALVYPGMCLLEGTNLSEGRGTTRPFEIFGAPWLNRRQLGKKLNELGLPGVYFRPVQFQPTFQKFQNEVCEGAFIHVTDPDSFQPVLSAIAILQEITRQAPGNFTWKNPPYEYEYKKLPFDILAGNNWLRTMIEELAPPDEIAEKMKSQSGEFEKVRGKYLIYRPLR